jgi:hypothetical protein
MVHSVEMINDGVNYKLWKFFYLNIHC